MAIRAKDLKRGMIIEYNHLKPGNRFKIDEITSSGNVWDIALTLCDGFKINERTCAPLEYLDRKGFKVINNKNKRVIKWL